MCSAQIVYGTQPRQLLAVQRTERRMLLMNLTWPTTGPPTLVIVTQQFDAMNVENW
jgi:hypothetical protein